ncbi:MAG: hypothetical protein R2825_30460 [Saprospiraceae bacterium]
MQPRLARKLDTRLNQHRSSVKKAISPTILSIMTGEINSSKNTVALQAWATLFL